MPHASTAVIHTQSQHFGQSGSPVTPFLGFNPNYSHGGGNNALHTKNANKLSKTAKRGAGLTLLQKRNKTTHLETTIREKIILKTSKIKTQRDFPRSYIF